MKKIICLLATVYSLSAMEMEMAEFKKTYEEVSPELLAAVVRVPAISKLLSKRYVTCPIDISDIAWDDEQVQISSLHHGQTHFFAPTVNYYNRPTKKRQKVNDAQIANFFAHSTVHQDSTKANTTFFFDGPNDDGFFASCSGLLNNDTIRLSSMSDEGKVIHSPIDVKPDLNTWSIAVSQNKLVAFSSVSTICYCAYLELFKYTCSTSQKLLGVPLREKTLTLDSKKVLTLMNPNYHVFRKISFLSEDLMLGIDQSGQLYTIEHYFDEKNKAATFHHLAFDKKNFSSIGHYALDSYDNHMVLMVDNNDDVRIGKITANQLITKKIRSLHDIKESIRKSGNVAGSLIRIRLAGNVCYLTFFAEKSSNKQIDVQFSLVSSQHSQKEKVD